MTNKLIQALDSPERRERLSAAQQLRGLMDAGELRRDAAGDTINNHIHTIYSFSPYSPSSAVFEAWRSGLVTAGIMDHDSIAGAEEFIEAGRTIGIATTVGMECRCSFRDTPFAGRRLNNPDQHSVAYLALHGVPHHQIGELQRYMEPYRQRRNLRNRAMTERINRLVAPGGIYLDFDRNVLPLSQQAQGGSVTERHILFALARAILAVAAPGEEALHFLEDQLDIEVAGANRARLRDPANGMYVYYLLGALKGQFVERFYIDADDELLGVEEFVALANRLGAVASYAYLGDVGESVTGDKKTQTFEDAYLEELVGFLKDAGFHALTYMPTRNSMEQLERVMALCRERELFEICGEDINSPFQSFVCAALGRPEFAHLGEAAWALIGHELSATGDPDAGMFTAATAAKYPKLEERIARFAGLGRELAPAQWQRHMPQEETR